MPAAGVQMPLITLYGVAAMAMILRRAHILAAQRVHAVLSKRTSHCPLRVVHWNVFEDGLTQAPSAIGFQQSFMRRLDALLAALADDGDGNLFMGFGKARDFSVVPQAVPLDSTTRLLGFVDVVYSAFYHILGGELRFDDKAVDDGQSPHLRMALRTLFLRTLHDVSEGVWHAPDFDVEVEKALRGHADVEARARRIKEAVFDERAGALVRRAWLY